MSAPAVAVCQLPDGSGPCPFADRCPETRQRIQSGEERIAGAWVPRHHPMWGVACWFWQSQCAKLGLGEGADFVAVVERLALRGGE